MVHLRCTLLLFVVSTFIAGCQGQVHPAQPSTTPTPLNVAALCESIRNIEVLPLKDEPVSDPAYNALVSAGEAAIPCLIRKITDETLMKDPRSAPKVGSVAVGDTASLSSSTSRRSIRAVFSNCYRPTCGEPMRVNKAFTVTSAVSMKTTIAGNYRMLP
jgi:hypothetical protein